MSYIATMDLFKELNGSTGTEIEKSASANQRN